MRTLVKYLALFLHSALASTAAAQDMHFIVNGETLTPLDQFQDCADCPEMIALPMGVFQMGASIEETVAARLVYTGRTDIDDALVNGALRRTLIAMNIDPDDPSDGLKVYYTRGYILHERDPQYHLNPFLHEGPVHTVVIDRPIAMGRNEVTRAEWAACVADGVCERDQTYVPPAEFISCDESTDCEPTPDARVMFRKQTQPPTFYPRGPMVGVTYYEMNDYVAWLNSTVGADVYRLPTEAEWEYAARAGTTTWYAQGDELTLVQANFLKRWREIIDGEPVWIYDAGNAGELLPVDALDAANPWGLRHMSGNASEFTSTCGEGPHRGLSTSSLYLAADVDIADCKRAVKGGMYHGDISLARPARRVSTPGDHWSPSLGFRVVRDLTIAAAVEDRVTE